jgi:hypothetical protein
MPDRRKGELMKHPIQKPVMVDKVLRFTENRVVGLLLDMLEVHGQNLNHLVLAGQELSKEDWDQFYQLIGYSLSGAPITETIREAAYEMFEAGKSEEEARAELAEDELRNLRAVLREPIANLFGVHPDDLKGDHS